MRASVESLGQGRKPLDTYPGTMARSGELKQTRYAELTVGRQLSKFKVPKGNDHQPMTPPTHPFLFPLFPQHNSSPHSHCLPEIEPHSQCLQSQMDKYTSTQGYIYNRVSHVQQAGGRFLESLITKGQRGS